MISPATSIPTSPSATSTATQSRPFFFRWQEAVRKARNLQAPTKALLFILSTYGDMDGNSIFPSKKQLAADLDLHETNVHAHLQLAVQAGFVVVHPQFGPKGQMTNLYELTLPRPGGDVPVTLALEEEPTPPQAGGQATSPPRTQGASTEVVERLRREWRLFLGTAPFPERAVRGVSETEARTALAWTLYRRMQGRRQQGTRLRNATGYFTQMLRLVDQGQLQARPYSERNLLALVERTVVPDQLPLS